MNSSALLDFEALKAVTGYQRQVDVERCLSKAGIRYFYARNGVWTTIHLVDAAGGLGTASNSDAYSTDIL